MADPERRRLLRLAGHATGAALLPASIRRALAIPADRRSGTIADVAHVVILIQENRSFDHYFGTLAGVRGYGDRLTVPQPGGAPVWCQRDAQGEIVPPFHLDGTRGNAQRIEGTPHGWLDAQRAWNAGRYGHWPAHKTARSMGYYAQAELPFPFALAEAFTVCDAYHAAIHGSTNPNRIFAFTGTNDPDGAGGGPVIDNRRDDLGPSAEGYRWTTYPERLEAAGVSWTLYQDMADNFTNNPLEAFRSFRLAWETDGGSPLATKALRSTLQGASLDGLRDDVLAGRLPQVSWIIAPAAYSTHPGPSCPAQGAWYLQAVLDALTADPAVWSRTVLLAPFDQNDGFFDHLPPPCPHSLDADGRPAGASTVDDAADRHRAPGAPDDGWPYGPGPRVPMLAISPWSRGGWVCSETYDHTSLLRFLEARFGVREPNISARRRAICGDLTRCFDFAHPDGGALPPLPRTTRAEADALRAAQERLPAIDAPRGAAGVLPRQAAGLRPSRALPYELAVDALPLRHGLGLRFVNSGDAGAVFHVHDRRRPEALPRRYTVEAGKSLSGVWDLDADGACDLWVLGPNGFHRGFEGVAPLDAAVQPEARLRHVGGRAALWLRLENAGRRAARFRVAALAYRDPAPREIEVAGGSHVELELPAADHGRWYDCEVRCADLPGFRRRYAGRVENGEPSISDPLLGAT